MSMITILLLIMVLCFCNIIFYLLFRRESDNNYNQSRLKHLNKSQIFTLNKASVFICCPPKKPKTIIKSILNHLCIRLVILRLVMT